MKANRKLILTSLVLDTLSMIFVCLSVLALMDIGGGREADLMLEWALVWLTVPLVLGSLFVSMVAIVKLARRKKDRNDTPDGRDR